MPRGLPAARPGAQLSDALRVAFGDPQAPHATLREILRRRGLLDPSGSGGLAPGGPSILSVGDHFDYPPELVTVGEADEDALAAALRAVGAEGCATLGWLAGLPRARATILLGNHDVVRVAEFAGLDDATFTRARQRAREVERATGAHAASLRERFRQDFPGIPTPGLVARDFSSWSEAQRALVARLLLDGRFALATTARLDAAPDVEVLVTHAGVTMREVGLLLGRPVGPADPRRIGASAEAAPGQLASALNDLLARAVDAVRRDWERGRWTPLDLSPLHVAGTTGEEGGGLLFHRPAHLESAANGRLASWAVGDRARPRRFDPRTLPRGLVQVCGHTAHRKMAEELGPWAPGAGEDDRRDGIRLLSVQGGDVSYRRWSGERPPSGPEDASMLLVDAGMHRSDPGEFPLLDLRDG